MPLIADYSGYGKPLDEAIAALNVLLSFTAILNSPLMKPPKETVTISNQRTEESTSSTMRKVMESTDATSSNATFTTQPSQYCAGNLGIESLLFINAT